MTAFELRFSIKKEFKNKKLVERLITFALIGESIFLSFVFEFY